MTISLKEIEKLEAEYGITGKEGFKLAVVKLFSKVIEEIIIGKDEKRLDDWLMRGFRIEVRNGLRAEQRAKLKDILNSRKDKK